MKYKIICWIPVEADEPEIYETEEEAKLEQGHMELMQPENKNSRSRIVVQPNNS